MPAGAQNPDPNINRTPAFQLEHFEPLPDPAVNVFNVAGADVRPHGAPSVGVLCHHARRPAIIDPEAGSDAVALSSVTRCELLGSIGLFGVGSLAVALPLVVDQQSPDPSFFNLSSQDFDRVVAGDLRVIPKVQLFERTGFGLAGAVLTPLHFPTGDGTTLNSGDGVQVEVRLALDWRHKGWQVAGNLGFRLLNPLQLHNVILDDAVRWGLAARGPTGVDGLTALASVYGTVNTGQNLNPRDLEQVQDDGRNDPAEALAGMGYALPWADLQVRLAASVGLNNGIGAADWRGLLGLDWVPPGDGPYQGTAWGEARGPRVLWQAILLVPAFVGVGPFVARRRSASTADAVLSVESSTAGEAADVVVTLEAGQASAFPRPDVGDAGFLSTHVAVSVTDDTVIAVEVPTVFGGSGVSSQTAALSAGLEARQQGLSAADDDAVGLGDVRLALKALALDAAEHTVGAGLVIPVTLPTATRVGFGRERVRIGSLGTFQVHLGDLDLMTNLGLHVEDDLDGQVPMRGLLEAGLGSTYALANAWRLGGEVFAQRNLLDLLENQPQAWHGAAVLVGRHPAAGLLWDVGVRAMDTAGDELQVDLVLKLGWRPGAEAAPTDGDGDGIVDDADRCPADPEDLDGFEDDDGCPEPGPDRDGDGVPDATDGCPEQPEDRDDFEDEDGCPEPGPLAAAPADRDGDGVLDRADRCPDEAEDTDGFQDDDGCPEPDNDGDRVPDADDRCPNAYGIRDWRGCNDLTVRVHFPADTAELPASARPTLAKMAAIIKAHPELIRVAVEGHTDDRGSEAFNDRLSLARAESVRRQLVKSGVPAGLIETKGYGEREPKVPVEGLEGAALERARALNRRVRFRLELPGAGQAP
ncbi:MAG: OmpA family protein [Myxococcales bacterium]|nr:OmpA family protein [Myxococcales bacterium]